MSCLETRWGRPVGTRLSTNETPLIVQIKASSQIPVIFEPEIQFLKPFEINIANHVKHIILYECLQNPLPLWLGGSVQLGEEERDQVYNLIMTV